MNFNDWQGKMMECLRSKVFSGFQTIPPVPPVADCKIAYQIGWSPERAASAFAGHNPEDFNTIADIHFDQSEQEKKMNDEERQVPDMFIKTLTWQQPVEDVLEQFKGEGRWFKTNWLARCQYRFEYKITRTYVNPGQEGRHEFRFFFGGPTFWQTKPEYGGFKTLKEAFICARQHHCQTFQINDDEIISNESQMLRQAELEAIEAVPNRI